MEPLKEYTIIRLKEILRRFGLPQTGNKAELIARILEADPQGLKGR